MNIFGLYYKEFISNQAYFDRAINTGMKIRVALVAAIYRKVKITPQKSFYSKVFHNVSFY